MNFLSRYIQRGFERAEACLQGAARTISTWQLSAACWRIRGKERGYPCVFTSSLLIFFLQALSMLLNGTPFAFVIDLAALASRREYLKLDKWLTDKIREHGVKQDFSFFISALCQ